MPRRTLLSSEQRTRLFGIPTEAAEVAKHYVLSAEDLALVRAKRRRNNRLGYAIQLCVLRHPGRPLEPSEVPPAAMLAFVANQVGADPKLFGDYAHRAETRREHLLELHAQLDRVAQAIIRTALGPHQREVLAAENVVLGHFSGFGSGCRTGACAVRTRERFGAAFRASGVMAEGRSSHKEIAYQDNSETGLRKQILWKFGISRSDAQTQAGAPIRQAEAAQTQARLRRRQRRPGD